jgi:hypothetical protein
MAVVGSAVTGVVSRMQQRLDDLPPNARQRRPFLGTYLRTTEAVGAAVSDGLFEDPEWVERWDVVFAELYLDAHDADIGGGLSRVPRPWRLAFRAPVELPALRHVLLGINAHVNYGLPQALLDMIAPADFADPVLIDRRWRDHERIDTVLAGRVGAEYVQRLGELEVLSAARVVDLVAPGQVLLRLAVAGFGVTLPPPRVTPSSRPSRPSRRAPARPARLPPRSPATLRRRAGRTTRR